MSASEKLKALEPEPLSIHHEREALVLYDALPQIVAVVEWMQMYADAQDWHAYVGTEGGRIDDEVDALLAALDEALS